jgi:hypothetical protein
LRIRRGIPGAVQNFTAVDHWRRFIQSGQSNGDFVLWTAGLREKPRRASQPRSRAILEVEARLFKLAKQKGRRDFAASAISDASTRNFGSELVVD